MRGIYLVELKWSNQHTHKCAYIYFSFKKNETSLFLFLATPTACGSSQAREWTHTTAATWDNSDDTRSFVKDLGHQETWKQLKKKILFYIHCTGNLFSITIHVLILIINWFPDLQEWNLQVEKQNFRGCAKQPNRIRGSWINHQSPVATFFHWWEKAQRVKILVKEWLFL